MQYRGTVQMVDDLNLDVRPYEDSIFEQWIKGFGDAYRQLFMEADMEPEDEDKEGNRRWANENRGNLFTFFDGSEFIGSCHLRDGYIRSMFVCPQHQGRGYGKRILQYIIAQAQTQGSDLIRLAVLDINERANNLYELQALGADNE
ncbi:GNAT family N-acetyltransferase [Alicyclobacillus fodiniaquatilis]|uniref:GNAT family N-acetyltransferase n=1 Tax=Alicyclobacillus fodiniaquatilis TaxID=1661150 RepID=A0ABW4JLX1_9BACL